MTEKTPKNLTTWRALNSALHDILADIPEAFVLGEDITTWGTGGGIYGVTRKLVDVYGPGRVRDTPISEEVLLAAVGAAAARGTRPILEIMYSDFSLLGFDGIINQAAKARYMFGGQFDVPLVIRTNGGSGIGKAAQHSQSLETIFAHVPGLEVAVPATPGDAYGLLVQAVRTDNPTIFLEHKNLYYDKGEVDFQPVAFGQARIARPGTDVTVVATQQVLHAALAAADQLAEEGIEAEIIDPRTLYPFDMETVIGSIRKTRHLIVGHEAVRDYGWGAEFVAQVAEEAWDLLDAAPRRIGGARTPIPYSEPLERTVTPGRDEMIAAVRAVRGATMAEAGTPA
ncbi:alpha-ketoacid dehydrogenase subunit beta [Sediminivirga luteola]|uniref:Pyruvate dehydrogenase subunit beta n=1 Tax=Sediminivirga luteola TaxID=1774748 RepID=A0A8J2XLE3_9MICO|nr:transketolase C-terminal domain-containing protein [Sediminivirga luteola]MCI2265123.1 alpha-ketoacid dehydrogenase subunit beta [Sediminivirga luteola]GGA21957.1 pyruvate dehydrogenase subunit beta [Sediminivirga luteola]